MIVIKSPPLSRQLIETFRAAGQGAAGDLAQEKIALAVLQYFKLNEITVWDITGTQVYFRLGAKGRHGIPGVHIHLPYFLYDPTKGYASGPPRAGGGKLVVGLVNDERRLGPASGYVGELLKALEQGRYQSTFVDD
jgi:hypothetical protein